MKGNKMKVIAATTETKHTSAPWKIEAGRWLIGADGTQIAIFEKDVDWEQEQDANKKLIVSAPLLREQLAAMRRLVAKLTTKTRRPVMLTEALTADEVALMVRCAQGQAMLHYLVDGVGRELPDRKPKAKLGRLMLPPIPTPQPDHKRHACGNVDSATGRREVRGE
jgi:hypothetical protein